MLVFYMKLNTSTSRRLRLEKKIVGGPQIGFIVRFSEHHQSSPLNLSFSTFIERKVII